MNEYEPKIVAFLCRWCSYQGADLAGTSRMKYPANVTSIRLMCSGRMDPQFVLKAFNLGADGVLICGCHPGDCHYQEGNLKTLRRFPLMIKLLEQFGIERERLRLEWVSASEGDRFVTIVKQMTADLKALGPLKVEQADKGFVKT